MVYYDAAIRFAVFLGQQAQAALDQKPRPEYIPEERWATYRHLAAEAISAMDRYLNVRTEAGNHELRDLCRALDQIQNRRQSIPFGIARLIENSDALMVETAMRIVLNPANGADERYQLARTYAERYDSRYGTGLIPDSAQADHEWFDVEIHSIVLDNRPNEHHSLFLTKRSVEHVSGHRLVDRA